MKMKMNVLHSLLSELPSWGDDNHYWSIMNYHDIFNDHDLQDNDDKSKSKEQKMTCTDQKNFT